MIYWVISSSRQHGRDRRRVEPKLADQLASVLEHGYPDVVLLLPVEIRIDVMHVQFRPVA